MEYTRTQKAHIQRQRTAMESVAGTDHGRILLRGLIDTAGVFEAPQSSDPIELAYQAGRRSMGLTVIHALNEIDPQLYARMVRDAANETTKARGQEPKQDDAD